MKDDLVDEVEREYLSSDSDRLDWYLFAPARRRVADNVIRFIRRMPDEVIEPEFTILFDADQGIDWWGLDWLLGKDAIFTVVFREGRVHYAGIFGETKYSGGVGFENSIPEEILQIFSKHLSVKGDAGCPDA